MRRTLPASSCRATYQDGRGIDRGYGYRAATVEPNQKPIMALLLFGPGDFGRPLSGLLSQFDYVVSNLHVALSVVD
jgi:hypothetical protein